jgi:tetratricopeptide (TPR) repeat protein
MKMKKAKIILFLFLVISSQVFSQSIFEQKYKLAQSFERNGDYSKAEELYLELYQQNKQNIEYFRGLVRCKKAQNKFSDLVPIIEERLQFDKSFDLLLTAGEIFWLTGNNQRAKSLWDSAIQSNPKDDSTYLKVAEVQSNLRQFNLAIETLLLGRKKLGSDLAFYNELISLYLITGNSEKCIDEILSAFERTKDFNWAEAKISLWIENKSAREIFEKKIKAKSSDINFKELYAWFLYSAKEFDKAFEVNKEIDEATKAQGSVIFRFAQTALNDGEYDVALKAFEYIISSVKKSPFLSVSVLGIAQATDYKILGNKKVDKALIQNVIQKYEQALESFQLNSAPYIETKYRIAELLTLYLGEYSKAENILKELVKKQYYPFLNKSKLLLGDIKIFQYQFDDGIRIFKEVLNSTKQSKPYEHYQSIFKIGKAYFYKSNFDSAQFYFAQLIEESPSDIASEALRISLFIEKFKQYNLAMSIYAQSEICREKKQLDSALILLRKAKVKVEGTDFEEYIDLQILRDLMSMEDFASAEQLALDFQKKYPSSIYFDEVLFNLGLCQYKQNKRIEAVSTFTELLTKFPRSIFNSKARIIINQIRNKES